MTAPTFTPAFVETVTGRQVCYRRGGSGPPVVLLHESPRSSMALMPLAERLATRFEVFALDSPGFGLSEPLPIARPSAEDFARALADTLDALGLENAPLYGTHTGAVIAMAFADAYPQRVTSLVLDGYPVFTAAEQEEFLASYLAPVRPDWDGAHLAWLWGRVKDQFTFFPWYRRGESARLPRPLPPLELLQLVVVDFLSAGDLYRAAYASAFRYEPHSPAARVRPPTTFCARSDDLLFGHLDRLGTLPATARIVRLGADRPAWAQAIGDAFAAGPPVARRAIGTALRPRATPRAGVITAGAGVVGYRNVGHSDAPPVVVFPPLPGAAAGQDALLRALAVERHAIALDTPGFGLSSPVGGDLRDIAGRLAEAIRGLASAPCEIVGLREGASVAAAVARGLGSGATSLTLVDPVPEAARAGLAAACVDVTPRADGTHLLAAWHQLRDSDLWAPWTERTPANACDFGTDPDVQCLHATFTEWMRGGPTSREAVRAALAQPLMLSPEPAARLRIVATAGHPWSAPSHELADRARVSFVIASADAAGLARALIGAAT